MSFFSIVLFAVADANYDFIHGNVGCQRRISDGGGVFDNTSFSELLNACLLSLPPDITFPGRTKLSPYKFVRDDAFSLLRNVSKPYLGVQKNLSGARNFNYRLSRAREISESVFGTLPSVFPKSLLLNPDKATEVKLATIYPIIYP